jgi:hypothetical protein
MPRIYWWKALAAFVIACTLWWVASQAHGSGGKVQQVTLFFPGPCLSEKLHVQVNQDPHGWRDIYPGTLKPNECIVNWPRMLAFKVRSCCEVIGSDKICSGTAVEAEEGENPVCAKKFNRRGQEVL